MARNLRQSRFRRERDMAEDINPSAYIVNLADCMLVLACGFMVAMMVYWKIDLSNVQELQKESLEKVDPNNILESIEGGGSYYIETGTVYQDPNTGQLWMVRKNDSSDSGGAVSGDGSGSSDSNGSAGGSGSGSGGSGGSDIGSGAIPSRAQGAD